MKGRRFLSLCLQMAKRALVIKNQFRKVRQQYRGVFLYFLDTPHHLFLLNKP